MRRFAVLIDLATLRLGERMLRKIAEDVESMGDIAYFRLYNYSIKKHHSFSQLICEYHIETSPSIQGRKRVRVDIREVIDAVRIAGTGDVTDIFLIASDLDAEPLIETLTNMRVHTIVAGTSKSTLSDMADDFYFVDRSVELLDNDSDNNYPCQDEVAIGVTDDSKVSHGKRDSIFPYSDIDANDIDAKMQEIDRRILEAIERQRNRRNMRDIFGDDIGK